MTDTITEPQAPPEESTPAPTPPAADTVDEGKQVEHTAGGFPVVPLSLSGTNTAAGLFATAALAGGPVAAAVAMTGAAVLGVAAAHQRTTKAKKKTPNSKPAPAAARTTGGSGGRGFLGRVPSQPQGGSRSGGRGTAGSRQTSGGHARHRAGRGAAGLRSGSGGKPGKPSVRQRAAHAAGGLAGGRAGQVQALRQQAKAQTPTRAAARTAAVQARRQVADTRRAEKAATRNPAPAKPRTGSDTDRRGGGAGGAGNGKRQGAAARTLAKAMGKAATGRDRAAAAGRTARDRNAGRTVAAGKQGIREAAHRKRIAQLKAPAQKAARKALLRSAVRFQARRAAAAVLGGLLGVLGMVTTPLGRKLRWAWLMNPGRRLYRFLLGRARTERTDRDADIHNELEDDERAAVEQADAERDQDTDGDALAGRASRPTMHVPAPPTSQGAHEMDSMSGFRFEELAAEMEQAAQSYEPESAMEILAMVEGLPEALTSIANVMRILAERSDSEFPLEKPIADGFSDIYGALTAATDVAEDLVPAFRMVHEADIARHEDPRNGPDAEKGWNV